MNTRGSTTSKPSPASRGGGVTSIGTTNHIAFDVAPEKIDEYLVKLRGKGVKVTEFYVYAAGDRVMGEIDRHDDVALITIRVASAPLIDLDLTFPAIPGSLPVVRQAIGLRRTGRILGFARLGPTSETHHESDQPVTPSSGVASATEPSEP